MSISLGANIELEVYHLFWKLRCLKDCSPVLPFSQKLSHQIQCTAGTHSNILYWLEFSFVCCFIRSNNEAWIMTLANGMKILWNNSRVLYPSLLMGQNMWLKSFSTHGDVTYALGQVSAVLFILFLMTACCSNCILSSQHFPVI